MPKPKLNITPSGEFHPRFSLKVLKVMPDLLQTREAMNVEAVRAYADAIANGGIEGFPGILIYKLPTGDYVLADGFHRVAAALKCYYEWFPAYVVEGTIEDALLGGIDGNFIAFRRGIDVTPEDKRHAVAMMLRNENFRDWSDSSIARQCVVGSNVVKKVRIELAAKEKLAIPAKVRDIDPKSKQTLRVRTYAPDKAEPEPYSPPEVRPMDDKEQLFDIQAYGREPEIVVGKEEADRKLAEIREREDRAARRRQALMSNDAMRAWLLARGVHTELSEHAHGTGCFSIGNGDAVYSAVGGDDKSRLYEAAGRLLLSAFGASSIEPGSSPSSGQLRPAVLITSGELPSAWGVALAALKMAGIGFTTPEDVVGAFGSKVQDGTAD